MKTLVLNAGSTSLKFKLFDNAYKVEYSGGFFDEDDNYIMKINGEKSEITKEEFENRDELIRDLVGDQIEKIGYRVVHGGEEFREPTKLTDNVIEQIEKLSEFAPLHNPPAVKVIKNFKKLFPTAEHFAVFDTAFHKTLPKKAFLYGIPQKFYKEYGIRKYGFHGISYAYVSNRLYELESDIEKAIICHIGGGVSVCAVKNGDSVETSMGFTPIEGALMATRSGGIDDGVIKFMNKNLGLSMDEIDRIGNFESGLLGVSGKTSDMKDLLDLRGENDEDATIAIDMFIYKLQKIIGSYAAVLNGVDALVFTAGIGSGSDYIRSLIAENLSHLNIEINSNLNDGKINVKEDLKISSPSSIPVWVIPTNEELQIAKEINN